MKLSLLLDGIPHTLHPSPDGVFDPEVSFLTDNTEECAPDCLFAALPGRKTDGGTLCEIAVKKGASVIMTERTEAFSFAVTVTVPSVREAFALVASAFFGHPSRRLKIIGVTGTNGKTTVASMIVHLLRQAGREAAFIGTVGYTGEAQASVPYTTPDPVRLHRLLQGYAENGTEYAVMEVSSQAIDQKRVFGLEFLVGVFTNLTPEHLDYHKTFASYRKTKLSFAAFCKTIIVNADCKPFSPLLRLSSAVSFSLQSEEADYSASEIVSKPFSEAGAETVCLFRTPKGEKRVTLPTVGRFQVSNALAAYACAESLGFDLADSLSSFPCVEGRCERVEGNTDYTVILDFAHTPDGLLNVLSALRPSVKGRLICLFGCGGDRDRKKRSVMGRIASENADWVVLTSDNPRSESPMGILREILAGIEKENITVLPDRRKAIEYALSLAEKDDLVLLAGKGHERYQLTAKGAFPFDERLIIKEITETERET